MSTSIFPNPSPTIYNLNGTIDGSDPTDYANTYLQDSTSYNPINSASIYPSDTSNLTTYISSFDS